jgi:hypothetical protein
LIDLVPGVFPEQSVFASHFTVVGGVDYNGIVEKTLALE